MIPVDFDVTLFVVAVLGAVVAVGMALLRQVLIYTERRRIAVLEERCAGLRKKQDHLTEHYRRTQDRVRDAEGEIKSMHVQIAEVRRRITMAKADNYLIVHELGEAAGNRKLFTGTLGLGSMLTVAQSTSKDSLLRGVRHLLEVWADNEAEALDLARRAFPQEGGFLVSKLHRADGTPSVAAPANKPRPMVRAAAAE